MRKMAAPAWLAVVGLVFNGCHKPYIMTETDYGYYNRVSADYDKAEYQQPVVASHKPKTVLDPAGKQKWELKLEEAKRIALENNKRIAALGYQPAEAATNIERALSQFDAIFEMGAGWGRTDQQVSNNIQTFGTGRTALQQNTFGSSSGRNAFGVNSTSGAATQDVPSSIPGADLLSLSKRNAAGGLTSINYVLDYSRTTPANQFVAVNPSWRSSVEVAFEQPFLQGAGVEFNRAPLLIARANHEQSIKEFEREVHVILRDVENAYWQLYFTYEDVSSRETGFSQALATWQKEKNTLGVGTGSTPQVAQAQEQVEFFRVARLQALTRLQTAEGNLRQLMGLPPDDDRRIIPIDRATIAEFEPNWEIGVAEAMELRPELVAQRFAIRAAELEVFRQRNGLLPDLSGYAAWRVSGLDNQFDQSIDRLTDNTFTDWQLGFRFRAPLGERAANAAVARSQATLNRQRKSLLDLEHNVGHDLAEAYRAIVSNFAQIQAQKTRQRAALTRLEAQAQFYSLGKVTIDVLLEAQTVFADATRDVAQAVTAYNQALNNWQFQKGTILINDNVVLAEEQVSRVSEKVLKRRNDRWTRSLPLPIHPGARVHGHDLPDSKGTLELYPDKIWTNETSAAPAEGEKAEPIRVPETPGKVEPAKEPAPLKTPTKTSATNPPALDDLESTVIAVDPPANATPRPSDTKWTAAAESEKSKPTAKPPLKPMTNEKGWTSVPDASTPTPTPAPVKIETIDE